MSSRTLRSVKTFDQMSPCTHIDDRPRQQAGIDHLQDVFDFQVLIHVLQQQSGGRTFRNRHSGPPGARSSCSSGAHGFPVRSGNKTGDCGRGWAGDENLLGFVVERRREIHLGKPCFDDRQVRHDDIAETFSSADRSLARGIGTKPTRILSICFLRSLLSSFSSAVPNSTAVPNCWPRPMK